MLSRLLEAHETILVDAHDAAARTAAPGDDGTNDLFVSQVIRTGELPSWFLAEHLVDTPLVRSQTGRRSLRERERTMDLRQMEVVVAVAGTEGFTAAARRLHMVQSTMSGTVRALERTLGTALFDRTTHHVALTPAGEAFVPAARATLRAAELAREAVDAVKGQLRGRITVASCRASG